MSERQGRLLEALVRRSSAPQRLVKRAQIILLLAAGKTFNEVARALGVLRQTVYKWGKRWRTQARQLAEVEAQERSDQALSARLAGRLLDAYRPGKPATPRSEPRAGFSPEQIVKLIAVACERPQDCGRPITRWSSRELAAGVVKRRVRNGKTGPDQALYRSSHLIGLIMSHPGRRRPDEPCRPALN